MSVTLTPTQVENVLKSSKYTAMPMAYALPTMSYCMALICPNKPPLESLAKEMGITGEWEELCANETLRAAVLKDVVAECKAAKLSKHETPQKVVLIADLWTPDNDMLTAVQKLKRRPIADKHKAEIEVTLAPHPSPLTHHPSPITHHHHHHHLTITITITTLTSQAHRFTPQAHCFTPQAHRFTPHPHPHH